jgi:hypothetical protein
VIANGVLDAVRAEKKKANNLAIIRSIRLPPTLPFDEDLNSHILFDIQRKSVAQAIQKAITNIPNIN